MTVLLTARRYDHGSVVSVTTFVVGEASERVLRVVSS